MAYTNEGPPLDGDIVSLLRRSLESERNVDSWDREDFLHAIGRTPDALVYSLLFAPPFVEVEGLIFLAALAAQPSAGWDAFALRLREARGIGGHELAKLIKGYNWIEVPYLFSDNRGTDEEDTVLAMVIAEAWRVRLRGLYPTRAFEVRVLSPAETGGVVGVGFRQRL